MSKSLEIRTRLQTVCPFQAKSPDRLIGQSTRAGCPFYGALPATSKPRSECALRHDDHARTVSSRWQARSLRGHGVPHHNTCCRVAERSMNGTAALKWNVRRGKPANVFVTLHNARRGAAWRPVRARPGPARGRSRRPRTASAPPRPASVRWSPAEPRHPCSRGHATCVQQTRRPGTATAATIVRPETTRAASRDTSARGVDQRSAVALTHHSGRAPDRRAAAARAARRSS